MTAAIGVACFNREVLNLYLRREDCVLLRTETAGSLQTPCWSFSFRLVTGYALQLSERELWKLSPAELAHWNSFRLSDDRPVALRPDAMEDREEAGQPDHLLAAEEGEQEAAANKGTSSEEQQNRGNSTAHACGEAGHH